MRDSDIGIFIHRTAYSESSVIVSYFTRKQGFMKFIFRGAKKKSSHLFPLNIQELTFYNRPESDLGQLSSVISTMDVKFIPFDPVRSSIAYFLGEVLQKCLTHTEKDEHLFAFLVEQIEELDTSENLNLFPSQFLFKLSYHLGIEPQIVDLDSNALHLADGEFRKSNSHDPNCSFDVSAVFLGLARGQEMNTSRALRKEVLHAILLYYKFHLENFGNLKSTEIVESLFQ